MTLVDKLKVQIVINITKFSVTSKHFLIRETQKIAKSELENIEIFYFSVKKLLIYMV